MPCTEQLVVSSSNSSVFSYNKEAVKQLLLVDLPKADKNINKSEKYLSMKKSLGSKEVDVDIKFLIRIKPVFDEFMMKFQKEEPMIHVLYLSTEKLLKH